jgi:mercuric ion transport protein
MTFRVGHQMLYDQDPRCFAFIMTPSTPTKLTGYLWTGLAVLVCPCHLPLIIGVLAGTSAGAMLGRHWALGLFGLVALFLVSAAQAWRRLSGGSCAGSCDTA